MYCGIPAAAHRVVEIRVYPILYVIHRVRVRTLATISLISLVSLLVKAISETHCFHFGATVLDIIVGTRDRKRQQRGLLFHAEKEVSVV